MIDHGVVLLYTYRGTWWYDLWVVRAWLTDGLQSYIPPALHLQLPLHQVQPASEPPLHTRAAI